MSRLNPLRRDDGRTAVPAEELNARADALETALRAGGDRLEPTPAARAGGDGDPDLDAAPAGDLGPRRDPEVFDGGAVQPGQVQYWSRARM